MNAPLRGPVKFDIQGLVQAIARNHSVDAFSPTLTAFQWEVLSSYTQPFAMRQGQVLIERKALDRTLYLVESGGLTVHYEDDKGRLRMALVEAGSAVGEGAFFTRQPRNATVQAASPSKVWCLTPIRFTELSNRNPAVALEIAMALGSLVARRLVNKPKRIAVT
ncbi:Crp/Fnr family transcriptional regulator [Caenimonas soli]|uniref:Crp/Fnr family transcriptional regulator n=1 Tax=Caenimonas soli TaxID=2735555 RepID=UPI0015545BBD|nr:cyclic nucleotide-binding domain-containing protein [Caenimonas soli]NPC55178.1 cyclic nucleotide-binding domain-containing protein [Caenimonas soli]